MTDPSKSQERSGQRRRRLLSEPPWDSWRVRCVRASPMLFVVTGPEWLWTPAVRRLKQLLRR